MALYATSEPAIASDLLAWPPLRVYTANAGTQWIPVADLVYLEGETSYTWLQWADGRRLLVPYTLKSFEAKLPSNWFVRLHRRYLVNRRFIERVDNDQDGVSVQLTTGMKCPISRRKWPQVYRQIGCSKRRQHYGTDRP